MSFKTKFAGLLAALALAPLSQVTANAEPLQVGMLHFPPYYVLEEQDKVMGGLLVDMLQKILKRAGIEYEMKGYPAKRLYVNVGDGTTQLWMGTLGVPDYEGKVLISPRPTTEIVLEIYSLGPKTEIPKSIDELANKSVITLRGYAYAGAIKTLEDPAKNIKINLTNSHDAAFAMLAAGRAPFVLDYKQPAIETIERKKMKNVQSVTLSTIPLYVLINKNTPNAQATMDKIMEAYTELKKEGSI